MNDTCKKCEAGCCKKVVIPILKTEPAADYFGKRFEDDSLPDGHRLGDDTRRPGCFIYDSNNKPCMFLDEETFACLIQDDKPIICKTFPLKWKHQHSFFIDLRCSLSHITPIKTLIDWGNQYKTEIAELIYYDFDQNDKEQYLNLRALRSRFDSLNRIVYGDNNGMDN